MKKHAYLIMAHDEFYILEILLKLLDDERNDIYLHIDKKVNNFDFDYFKNVVRKSNIYFTKRLSVNWGEDVQIKCELLLLREATKKKYSYYHLLSGVDLPLKTQDEIHEFFDNCGGKELVHFCYHHEIDDWRIDRVNYYHLFLNSIRSSNKYKRFIYEKLHSVFLRFQKRFNVNRVKGKKFYYGANWFSITDDLARYVLGCEKEILKTFRKTICADEIFLQTIVYDSKFKDNLYLNEDDDYRQIMRYIDWNRGGPYTFRREDFEELINSCMLFARKFSCKVDKEVVDMIYGYLGDDNE